MTRARSLSKLVGTSIFTVDGDDNVGLNSTSPDAKLDVVGVISATSFFGSGSGLTGVASTDNIITGTAATFNNVVKVGTAITLDATSGIITATGANVTGIITATTFNGNVTGSVTGVATGLTGTPDITVRNITGVAATFSGVLSYDDVTNVDSIGIVTARSGIIVTAGVSTFGGNVLPDGNGTRDLGATGTRWANLFTSDIDLSNEAKGGNEIDGTWGSYTIQEGENDLFLINRRNGKRYKFVLQEVS
tara:strand:+ start:138 stop:881 length:744 start_codon:yes stop_codon:yes gene_type:complete